jgi:hypothetical protein
MRRERAGRDGKEGSTVRVHQRALQNAARRRFCVQVDLLVVHRAMGMEPVMELSRREVPNRGRRTILQQLLFARACNPWWSAICSVGCHEPGVKLFRQNA